jgi:hypothetical protein
MINSCCRLLQKMSGGESYHLEYMKRVKSSPSAPIVLNIVPYLDKLTQIAMESDMVSHTNMINFDKRRKIATILTELSLYQRKNYDLVCSFLSFKKTNKTNKRK